MLYFFVKVLRILNKRENKYNRKRSVFGPLFLVSVMPTVRLVVFSASDSRAFQKFIPLPHFVSTKGREGLQRQLQDELVHTIHSKELLSIMQCLYVVAVFVQIGKWLYSSVFFSDCCCCLF